MRLPSNATPIPAIAPVGQGGAVEITARPSPGAATPPDTCTMKSAANKISGANSLRTVARFTCSCSFSPPLRAYNWQNRASRGRLPDLGQVDSLGSFRERGAHHIERSRSASPHLEGGRALSDEHVQSVDDSRACRLGGPRGRCP